MCARTIDTEREREGVLGDSRADSTRDKLYSPRLLTTAHSARGGNEYKSTTANGKCDHQQRAVSAEEKLYYTIVAWPYIYGTHEYIYVYIYIGRQL